MSLHVQRWRHSHHPPTNIKIWIFLQILGNSTLAGTVNFATSANPASWELWLFFSLPPEHSIPLRGRHICNTLNRKLAFEIQSQFCLLSLAMVLSMVLQFSPLNKYPLHFNKEYFFSFYQHTSIWVAITLWPMLSSILLHNMYHDLQLYI